MNYRVISLIVLSAALVVVAPVSAQEAEPGVDKGTRNCISTRRIRRTKIVDDRNVLIYLSGRTVLHNTLRQTCAGLEKVGTFTITSSDGVLCAGDGISPMSDDPWGPVRPIPTCWLGVHHDITREEADAMLETSLNPPDLTPAPEPLPMPEPSEVGVESTDPE